MTKPDDKEATRAFWAGVDKAAKEVREWPAWKRGEWREYPATVSASAPSKASTPPGSSE